MVLEIRRVCQVLISNKVKGSEYLIVINSVTLITIPKSQVPSYCVIKRPNPKYPAIGQSAVQIPST